MQAVVLAAGLGTRLEPLGGSKVMIPIANRPMLHWLVEALPQGDIILVVRKGQQDVIDYFSADDRVRFVYQDTPRGTGDALKQCKDLVDSRFLAVNGDCYAPQSDLAGLSRSKGSAVATFASTQPQLFGSVQTEGDTVTGIREKSGDRGPINAGMYVFDETIFRALDTLAPSPRGEYELTDAINALVRTQPAQAFPLSAWHTVTFPWDILALNEAVLKGHGSMISESAEIRSGAVIHEPVAIGSHAIVGPNCFIRTHSSIGAQCKVGNAVEIKNSVVMEHSFVSHLSYVGDSIVGRRCNIGAGAIFANLRLDEKTVAMTIRGERVDSGRKKLGAVVGDHVKLGVNVTIMPGKKIYPNILVPACYKVEEDITEQMPLK